MTQSIQLGSQMLVARCAEAHDFAARSMLETLASRHKEGPPLAPGTRIDFGWAVLQIEAAGEQWLVCEPDFDSEPMNWRPTVDATLGVLDAQALLMRALRVAPEATCGHQTLWLAPDALDADSVYLHRSEPDSTTDSGWYIGRDQSDKADKAVETAKAVRTRAGRLLTLKPEWLSVLALPRNYLVQFSGGELSAIYNDQEARIYPRVLE